MQTLRNYFLNEKRENWIKFIVKGDRSKFRSKKEFIAFYDKILRCC